MITSTIDYPLHPNADVKGKCVLVDNDLADIIINGVSTGLTTAGFDAAHQLSIPASYFHTGNNTVTFAVDDAHGVVTGLDVKWLGVVTTPAAHERYTYDTSNRRVSKAISTDGGVTYPGMD